MRIWNLLWLLVWAWAAPAGASEVLVDPAWLKSRLGREELVLLDASVTPRYQAGHIAGAVSADIYTLGADELPAEQLERRLQAWGVTRGRTIVIYDEGGSMMAPRLYWELLYQGVPASQLRVLDGGLAMWQQQGGAVTRDAAVPRPGDFRIGSRDEQLRSRLADVLAASADPARHTLVDALDAPYYYGGVRFFDRGGHLPHAKLLPVGEFFNADKTFKAPAEIERMARFQGLSPGQTIHAYCGGGVAAAVPFFALKVLLGWPEVRLYRGSQHEWLRDERGLPIWTYAAPYLKREASWLASWNAPMLRAFGVARIDVIDARSDEAYRLGHLPGAIHLPAERFREHWADPERLRPLLAAAGLNPAHEAVIVAERGVDGSSALAWLMLRRLGHPKVSILMDSVDEWGLLGHPLEKAAAPAAKPRDFAVPARASLMLPSGELAANASQRVLLDSGAAAMPIVAGARQIHLPASELLDGSGRPKPAHQLWDRLVKAGVPRHTELVARAADPGDAAIAAYVLELMGVAGVKVAQ